MIKARDPLAERLFALMSGAVTSTLVSNSTLFDAQSAEEHRSFLRALGGVMAVFSACAWHGGLSEDEASKAIAEGFAEKSTALKQGDKPS